MTLELKQFTPSDSNYILLLLPLYHEKQDYIKELSEIPLESFYDGTGGDEKCKAIGQQIFNHYKEFAFGETIIGMEATSTIWNEIATSGKATDYILQKFVARAWKGIGDKKCRWKYNPNVAAKYRNWQIMPPSGFKK